MPWFGVKTIFQTCVVGRPKHRDGAYVPGATSIEQRIVLVRAKDGDAAVQKAMHEARAYAAEEDRTNIYGQQVKTRFLEAAESYEMFDNPADGTEVWSTTRTVDRKESRSAILKGFYEEEFSGPRARAWRMFVAASVVEALDAELGTGWDREYDE